MRDWAARGHREWKGASNWRVKATEESLVVVGLSNGHHNWRQWTLNWLLWVFHRWPIRPWPFTCYLALQADCCSQMAFTDWTKEARLGLDIALAETQLEVNDILCRFSASSELHVMTRLFKKIIKTALLWGQLNTKIMFSCCKETECKKKTLCFRWIETCYGNVFQTHTTGLSEYSQDHTMQ